MAIIDAGNVKIVVDMPNKKVEKAVTKIIRPLPFECKIYDKEPVEVKNKLSGDSCMLEPDAVAVFDVIKGQELIGILPKDNPLRDGYDTRIIQDGLKWFRKYFPKEYMILLD